MKTIKSSAIVLVLFFLFPLQVAAQRNNTPINFESATTVNTENLTPAQKMCLNVVSAVEALPQVEEDTTVAQPKYWKVGLMSSFGLSQVSLTNWAEGGSASVALNTFLDANAIYEKDKNIWENRFQLAYGFTNTFDSDTKFPYKKSEDRILLDSKWGHLVYERLYLSAFLNFRTQMTPGFGYTSETSTLLSQFMAPAYLAVGCGIDYKPFTILSINVSPVTGNFVFVTKEELRAQYGNNVNQAVRAQLGAQVKLDLKYAVKDFKLGSTLTLFSDYLHNPENVQVYWDFNASYTLRKFFTISLRTNLIYDDNIKIADKDGYECPRVQFKEVFSLNFAYAFGQYQKAK